MTNHPNYAKDGTLHHIGVVVASITEAVSGFGSRLGLQWDERVYSDPIQTVLVTFLTHPTGAHPQMELVQPASAESRVSKFLKRGGGLHHFCYAVDSLEERIERELGRGAILIAPPAPAVAFENRRIAWMITPERMLIEYLELERRKERDAC